MIEKRYRHILLTTNGEFWASSCELKEVPTIWQTELTHCLEQVLHTLAIHMEAVVCFDRIGQSYAHVSVVISYNQRELNILSRDQSSSTLPNNITNSSGVKALKAEYGKT